MGSAVNAATAPSAIYSKRLKSKQVEHRANLRRQLSGLDKHKAKDNSKPVVSGTMPVLERTFAVSQDWRCAFKHKVQTYNDRMARGETGMQAPWFECNRADKKYEDQLCVMGYSFRSNDYRYTIWLHFNREKNVPDFGAPPYAEELYDHRGEVVSNFTRLEYQNLIGRPQFAAVATNLRQKALHFLQTSVSYMGPYPN